MKVILLERVGKLGGLGDEVNVKDGFARNHLLPSGKALRANDANRAQFEAQRAELQKQNESRRNDAQSLADKLDGTTLVVIRSAGETGQLYGSVSTRDISADLAEQGFSVAKNQVELSDPIKTIGMHWVTLALHAEVTQKISLNVARSADEAERQAAGEDLSVVDYGYDEDDAPAADELLEEGVELDSEEAEEASVEETTADEAQ